MSQTYSPPDRATRLTRFVLVGVWAVFTLVALSFVVSFGSNAPYADEWEFVPAVLGKEPALPWLWQQHNEHRLPLPRAIFLTLFAATHDFRSGMVLQVLMMSALALWMMRVAAQLRGGPHWADVFFPISLLHLGHWENFLMGYQVCFALFCVLATAIGVVALRTTRENAFRSGVVAGMLALLAALTGGSGLVLALPVAAWVAYLAFQIAAGLPAVPEVGRTKFGGQARRYLLFALALLPLVYLGAYFIGYEKPAHHPKPGDGGVNVLKVFGQTLAMAFGIGLSAAWLAVLGGLVVLGVSTLVMLRKSDNRPVAVGLVAVAAGVAGVALAIGVGRGGFDSEKMGLWARYSFLMWPLVGLAYLAWVKRGGWGGRWVPMGLCVAAALAFPANTLTGIQVGIDVKATLGEIELAAGAGAPPEQIVERFKGTAQAGQEERAVRAIPMLREAGVGRFAGK